MREELNPAFTTLRVVEDSRRLGNIIPLMHDAVLSVERIDRGSFVPPIFEDSIGLVMEVFASVMEQITLGNGTASDKKFWINVEQLLQNHTGLIPRRLVASVGDFSSKDYVELVLTNLGTELLVSAQPCPGIVGSYSQINHCEFVRVEEHLQNPLELASDLLPLPVFFPLLRSLYDPVVRLRDLLCRVAISASCCTHLFLLGTAKLGFFILASLSVPLAGFEPALDRV